MYDPKLPASEEKTTRQALRERQQTARRVYLDPSSPSVRSIVRVVVITLLILFIAGSVQNIVSSIASLVFLVILSIFFAYLIDPIVKIIRRPFKQRHIERFMPRSIAIVIAYVFIFTVVGIAISYIAPRAVEQAKEFGENLPAVLGQSIRLRAIDLNQRFDRLRIPEEVQADLNKRVSDLGGDITSSVGNFVLMSVTYLPWFILVPILSFFFLKDVNKFRLGVLRMFPAGRWRIRAESVMADVNTTIAAYTRARLISCILVGLISTLGFLLLGLKYALLLGILAGIFEFIPLLGSIVVGAIVILTAAASDEPWKAIYVAIFLIVLRVIHNFVTYPRIVRGGMQMHPLVIILSVLAGQQVAGIPGVFLSIPVVAIATVIYKHVLEHQGRRGLLSGWIETEAEPPPEEIA